jgi:hypothetical protein
MGMCLLLESTVILSTSGSDVADMAQARTDSHSRVFRLKRDRSRAILIHASSQTPNFLESLMKTPHPICAHRNRARHEVGKR